MEDNVKYRHELKYQCSIGEIVMMKNRIKNVLNMDEHVADKGEYSIRSLYFDSHNNRCFWENENGTDPREKFRIRIYNADKSRISLECKRKERGKTYKTSCLITEAQYWTIMNGCVFRDVASLPPLLRKFVYVSRTQLLKPVVIVEYNRIPYIHENGNVRITFDTNIRTSENFDNFFESDINSRPIMMAGQHLLEVKYDELLPDYIKELLQIENMQQTAFSKYYLCRKFTMRGVL